LRFSTIDCSGVSVDQNDVLLDGAGTAESDTFTTIPGSLSYKVHYDGDINYPPDDGPCEPLTVGAVGGVVELRVASGGGPESGSQADDPAKSRSYGLLATGLAAGAFLAMAAGGWYARRRWLR
jgi:hypothetical protein